MFYSCRPARLSIVPLVISEVKSPSGGACSGESRQFYPLIFSGSTDDVALYVNQYEWHFGNGLTFPRYSLRGCKVHRPIYRFSACYVKSLILGSIPCGFYLRLITNVKALRSAS